MDLRHRLPNAATAAVLVALLATGLTAPVRAQPAPVAPLIKQDAAIKVSEHVYVILDNDVGFVPNVGIVVGERATLVVDTGLGDRNGAIILAEARKLSDNTEFYLTATHFHPEHDLGATAFPDDAKMVRWRDQQAEADEVGAQTIERFKQFSPVVAELLAGARFRPVDTLFDREHTINLGGVRVRVMGAGPNHTRGDTVMFVGEDRVLFTGDVVMSVLPAASAQQGSVDKWLVNLDTYDELEPMVVVPAHGRLGGVNFVRRYRDYFSVVRERTRAAKSAGRSLEAAQAELAPVIAERFVDLAPAAGSPTGRINAAIAAAFREAP
jgi:glyoxylase-like metal-dependent hydrolase (beta-lactamase superfamily II)